MCGITVIAKDPNYSLSPKKVMEINDSVSHRGPDAFGSKFFFKKKSGDYEISNQGGGNWNIALCHRRLSIIDLSKAGDQPMSYDTGNYWITYNGEIYNYLELRKELKEYKWKFTTSSDIEVLANSWKQWGYKMFEKLNGMFAISIYDKKKNIILLARDIAGEKPLYYSKSGNKFYFSSEAKAIKKVCDNQILEYFESL